MTQEVFYHYLGHYFIPIVTVLIGIGLPFMFRHVKYVQIKILGYMSMLYFVGKSCAILLIGPRFIRWYLDDIGWISMFSFVCIIFIWFFSEGILTQRKVDYAVWAGLLGFVSSTANEGLMLWVQYDHPEHKKIGGDWVDMLIFFFTYMAVLHILGTLHADLAPPPTPHSVGKKKGKRRRR